jgi:patatin-related protein
MREKELRLALVCYGGISLAVYMHGITKEIWKLSRASRAFHADDDDDLSTTEGIYRDILEDIAGNQQLKIRVLTDIITGASAGGINGIFLAKAIATGQSIEPLTKLWLEEADVDKLLDPDARPISRFTKFWAMPVAWYLANRSGGTIEKTVAIEARQEVRSKLTRFVRARWFEPPFGGQVLSGMILDAFAAMDKSATGKPLLPAGQPLDLAVTVTDFRGHPELLHLNSPNHVVENEHRLVLSFRHDPDQDMFLSSSASLAFAARATSSFPGAFPPLKLAEMDQFIAMRGDTWSDRADFVNAAFPKTILNINDLTLVDGSVLANAPFHAAIDKLKDRPARREVDRRFVYIDPKPGIRAISLKRAGQSDRPGFFTTIIGAMSELPREQPIRDNLDAIDARSTRIRRMQHIVDALTPEVEDTIQSLFGRTFFLDRPTPKRVASWRVKAHERSASESGFAYAAYAHLKLSGIVEEIADLAARISAGRPDFAADQFRRDLWNEIRARGVDQISSSRHNERDPSVIFFRQLDLGFRIRRLRFLARNVTAMVDIGEASDADLIHLRSTIYDRLAPLIDMQNAGTYKNICIDSPSAFLDALADQQDLVRHDAETDEALAAALTACPKALCRRPLLTYLGFPFYDISTLPMLQGEGLDEFNPIKVDRIAPDDAQSIRSGGAAATLKGIEFNSFGAFFSRKYRENDYLWGRLHGAERLIDIIFSTAPSQTPDVVDRFKYRMLSAILAEEETQLNAVADLFPVLRAELAQGPLAKMAAVS